MLSCRNLHNWLSRIGSSSHSLCCESVSEERSGKSARYVLWEPDPAGASAHKKGLQKELLMAATETTYFLELRRLGACRQ